MTALEVDLRRYYEQEAGTRVGRTVDPLRVERRDRFCELVRAEARSRVLEVGAGPGRDAVAFDRAGLVTVAVDLAYASCELARRDGVRTTQSSLFSLPFAAEAFDAGWTMSTLVHIPDTAIHDALGEMVAALRPGAPLAVGTWGGVDLETTSTFDTIVPARFFSLRSHERLQEILARHATIEQFDTWAMPGIDWQYQFAVLRTR